MKQMEANRTNTEPSFWEGASIYQIYPRSFMEVRLEAEDLRGEGSLLGIIDKLDYLKDLGINAIWISPFFMSPMEDGGYDVSDYTAVDPRYGTLEDFNALTSKAHELGIKIMVDLIPNHTSDQHSWFEQSRSSRDNPKADWYVWADPVYVNGERRPPNNWASVFSKPQLEARKRGELGDIPEDQPTPPASAWEWDGTRQQYYLHSFAEGQPDVNFHNPEVREAVKNGMRFWLDLGVDAFRIDAVNYIGKDPELRDEEPNPDYVEGHDSNPYDQLIRYHSAGYTDTFYPYIEELVSVLNDYKDKDPRIIFEAYMPDEDLSKIDSTAPKVASSFNFTRLDIIEDWRARLHQEALDGYYRRLPKGSIANHVNGNHDKPRIASRIGFDPARVAAFINGTLPKAMWFIFQGEEGNFINVEVPEELQDDKLGGRDEERTPMLWTPGKNAGFSDADRLWLPNDSNYKKVNLETQGKDPFSTLNLFKALLAIRNGSPTIKHGNYHPLFADNPDVLAFAGRYKGNQYSTVANFTAREISTRVLRAEHNVGRVLLSSTHLDCKPRLVSLEDKEGTRLGPNEAIVVVPSA